MTEFSYKAITVNGEVSQGTIDASSEPEAISKLQQNGLSPLEIRHSSRFSLQQLWQLRKNVGQAPLTLFTQQLSTMINAGLPLERALQLLSTLTQHPGLKVHLNAILDQVRDGVALSSAFESRSRLVSKLYISMIRAGEMGGTLGKTLANLSDYLVRTQDLKRSLVSALIYPAILLIMAIASVITLLVFVVPSFSPMFEELGSNMPAITSIVLGGGAFLQSYWWLLIIVLICILVGIRQQLSQAKKRLRFHRWLLQQKKLGDLLAKMETARFARTLGALLVNGVPILRGLSLASDVVENTDFSLAIKNAMVKVKTGKSLAEALEDISYFPDMALQMLIVGQETGQVGSILLNIADTYDIEVKTTTDRLLNLLVPVLILLLSLVVATIVISILLAILSVNDLFG